jgi:hypothetical protein
LERLREPLDLARPDLLAPALSSKEDFLHGFSSATAVGSPAAAPAVTPPEGGYPSIQSDKVVFSYPLSFIPFAGGVRSGALGRRGCRLRMETANLEEER